MRWAPCGPPARSLSVRKETEGCRRVKRKVAARAAWPAARDELPRGIDRKEYRFDTGKGLKAAPPASSPPAPLSPASTSRPTPAPDPGCRLPRAPLGGSRWHSADEAGRAGGGRTGGRGRGGVAGRAEPEFRAVPDRRRAGLPSCRLVVHWLWADRPAATAGQPAGAGDDLRGLRLVRDVSD